jgi:hypothetical protein
MIFISCNLFEKSLEEQLIGTWSQDNLPSYTITFKANGIVTDSDGTSGEWTLSGNEITIDFGSDGTIVADIEIYDDKLKVTEGSIKYSFTRE